LAGAKSSRAEGLLIAAVGAAVGAAVTVVLGYLLTRPPQVELLFRDEATPPATEVAEQLPAASIIYFSGSQFEYQNQSCANGSNLCVLIDTFTTARPVRIEGVNPTSNFVEGWIGRSTFAELSDKEPSYWDGRNCSGHCSYVDVYLFEDGQLEHIWRLTRPPAP
jgi:hypothetical protein